LHFKLLWGESGKPQAASCKQSWRGVDLRGLSQSPTGALQAVKTIDWPVAQRTLLQLAACSLQLAACSLQLAACSLQLAACSCVND
jgi:hypothetical protein